jgi:CRP/FNR family transcriptional regulator, cyclic AMP receptor protein
MGNWLVTTKPKTASFDPDAFLAIVKHGRAMAEYRTGQVIFSQGDTADSVFYIVRGKIKIAVTSEQGREAVVGLLGERVFWRRLSDCAAFAPGGGRRNDRCDGDAAEPAFAGLFTAHLLTRNSRIEADLVDQLFNSSERRLARTLLLLANFGKEGSPQPITAKISQETLAEMVGTTRPRVSFFMNKFRKLGFIDYNGKLKIHNSLLSVVLRD